jgi:6-phosphogluconolactonase
MTAPLINMADNVLFMVSGIEKADILDLVLNGDNDPEKYPAQLISPTNGKLYWYIDKKAAALV